MNPGSLVPEPTLSNTTQSTPSKSRLGLETQELAREGTTSGPPLNTFPSEPNNSGKLLILTSGRREAPLCPQLSVAPLGSWHTLEKTEGPGRNLGLKLQRSAEELPATGTGTSLENCFGSTSTHRYRDDGDPRVLLHLALSQGLCPRRYSGQI